ncbi:Endosulfine-domain-containing protein [Plenodomus tracheiphilus IPT5]|uniref:mRNA stability protein n=1 Tax=Plenodomus tracheiphilus IPT5 TaxID=1408161 RepID=A0A6A7AT70_9PLEO|nr:Endosulfine-domain-containing protein [Plenodomus tracheiphilus IPT5]
MNPHQQNKVDISKMSTEEAKLFRLYGKLPNKKDLLQNKLKERKYFDSGDYALSKAGKASDVGVTQVGREHPNPEKIPHIAPPTPTGQQNGTSNNVVQGEKVGSPVKEHTFLHRETSLNRETSASDFEKENVLDQPQEGAAKA